MNEKVNKIKLAYSKLDWDERSEIREFIKEFEDKLYSEKEILREDLRKSLGPISSLGCPICGK